MMVIVSNILFPNNDSHDDHDYKLYIVTMMTMMIIIHSVRGLKQSLSRDDACVVHQDAHNPNLVVMIKTMMMMMIVV